MEPCERHGCVKCCKEAEVPLLNEDIDRIRMLGYYDAFFTQEDSGVKTMRRLDGKCIFFQEHCEIYAHRPEFCRFVPLTYDASTHQAIYDENCCYAHEFNKTESEKKALVAYVDKLQKQIEWRVRTGYNY